MLFSHHILAVIGRGALALVASASVGQVTAEYPSNTAAYDSFMHSIRVLSLSDHSLVVTHLTPAESESGITATVLRADGTTFEWRASDWLEEVAQLMPSDLRLRTRRGQVGQIYSAALLPVSKRLAVSIGWRDVAGKSENGIALVRAVGRSYVAEKIFVLPMSVGDLASGPDDTIVSAVFNAVTFRTNQQTPMLAVLDTDGNVLAQGLSSALPMSEGDAARNMNDSRVIGLSENRVALVTPGLGKASFVRLERKNGDAPTGTQTVRAANIRVTVESVVNLGRPAAGLRSTGGQSSVRAVYVDHEQRVGVLYNTATGSGPTLALVLSSPAGASETAVVLPGSVRGAYWADGQLQTVIIDADRAVVAGIKQEATAR
jgi:hypothetical protein